MLEQDPNAALGRDVRLLGEILGRTLQEQVGSVLYEKVEAIRQLSKRAFAGDQNAHQPLNDTLKSLTNEEILIVVRAFSHFLNCANIAENVHRIRRTRWYMLNRKSSPQPGSLEASFKMFDKNIPPEQIYEAVRHLRIDLVLTAHPTEVMRRTLIQKFDHLGQLLLKLDDSILTMPEMQAIHEALHREMTAIWLTNEIRRKKPTPIDEAKWGFAIVETSLWKALPNYLRDLDEQLQQATGRPLPLLATPIRFSAWMGGDRDGNPNVTAKITQHVCLLARWTAADLYLREITQLSGALSMEKGSAKIHAIVGDVPEPYRIILRHLRKKLHATKRWIEETLAGLTPAARTVIKSKKEILYPLLVCYQSLMESGASCIAKGDLTDTIRRVACFGVSLLPLDIRQEASVHSQMMEEVTQYLELGSYLSWNEIERQDFILAQLQDKRPFIPQDMQWSEPSQENWHTLQMLAEQLPSSLGAYVISMCAEPSDVLLVCLLQREAGIKHPLRVVPLFETLNDLEHAHDCMQQLFSLPWYDAFIRGRQEIMIGYSDSGKDAGMLAAGFAQYCAQERLAIIAKQHDIHLTLFHGRGGSVGRGGAPAHLAILSQPPLTFNGSMRVTEQGEVIRNKYGLAQRAHRTLSLYTTANLQGLLLKFPEPKQEWRDMMQLMSQKSYQHYCQIVKGAPAFVEYFQQATPEREIGSLAIGSRPARRRQGEASLESLRAIPWVFAWTQNRLLLPAWLGVGQGLQAPFEIEKSEILKEMIQGWPFFGSLLNMIEMVLAKTSADISHMYETRLVASNLYPIGEQLRTEYANTVQTILKVLDEKHLLSQNPLLARTLQLRSPYLYPLHVLQAELLWRVRHAEPGEDALLVSISGIAAGMQNTG